MMCKLCPFKTSSKEVMEKHVLDRHSPEEKIATKQTTGTGRKRKSTAQVDELGECKKTQRREASKSAEHHQNMDNGEKSNQFFTSAHKTKKSFSGTCRVTGCGKKSFDLGFHNRNYHSGRSHQCPFCQKDFSTLTMFTKHLRTMHPYKVGVLPGRSGEPPLLDQIMSGNALIEMMRGYGQDVVGAVAYQFFAVSYDPANLCHRWVAFEVTQALLDTSENEEYPPASFAKCPKVIEEQPNSFAIHRVGCDHGHAAPAFLYRAFPTAYQESCLFPNISAQRAGFNNSGGSVWERNEKRLAKRNDRVIVITGPTYNSNDEIGWVEAGCGYKHRIPEGFYRFVIIRNRGQPDAYQAFYYPNEGDNEKLFVDRYSIEELQEKIGPKWELLPGLRTLTYTWQNENISKYCHVCKVSVPKSNYDEHFESHGFICRYGFCSTVCGSAEELKEHKLTQHPNMFICEECAYQCSCQSTLDEHIAINHTKGGNFPCTRCGKRFHSKRHLNKHHKTVHALVKRYYCPMDNCEKGFVDSSRLKIHCVAKHSRTNRFFCPDEDCNRNKQGFEDRANLILHRREKHQVVDAKDPEISNQTTGRFLEELLAERGMTTSVLFSRSEEIQKRKQEELARQGLDQEPLGRDPRSIIHPQAKMYYCPFNDCEYASKGRTHFTTHYLGVHSRIKRFYCPDRQCMQERKVFRSKNALIRHRKNAHNITTKKDPAISNQTVERFLKEFLSERGMTLLELFIQVEEKGKRKNEELVDEEDDA